MAPENRAPLHADDVLKAARSFVVTIESLDRRHNSLAQGSGVIIGKDVVVTSWPLVSRASFIRIRHHNDVRFAVTDAVLEGQGLARLRADAAAAIELGRDAYPSPGMTIYAVGSRRGAEVSLSEGIVAGMRDTEGGVTDHIETTIPLSTGLAGGALLNAQGELIGIVAPAGVSDTLGRALPVRYVKDLLSLPSGTLPLATTNPLLRLPVPDRKWLVSLMASVVREGKPLGGRDLDRATALLDRLEPLVGAELAWAKVELGFGWLSHQKVFWEDAVEAFTFRRVVKSPRRAALEKSLLALHILTPLDLDQGDATMRAVAAHDPFDAPGARIVADDRWLAQMVGRTDQMRRRLETQLREARYR